MKFQGLFSKKNKFFLECRLLQILLGALRVNIKDEYGKTKQCRIKVLTALVRRLSRNVR